MKLNLGCGNDIQDGFVNVDKYVTSTAENFERWDLETFPWPWETSSVSLTKLFHILEHLGRDPDVFCGIMKELYRVSAPNGLIHIVVPHPRHDFYIGDPTHVRPVIEGTMQLFSKKACAFFRDNKYANTPLAFIHDVDFEVEKSEHKLDKVWQDRLDRKIFSLPEVQSAIRSQWNVVEEIRMLLKVVK